MDGEFYHDNQTVCISFYIKHIMLIPNRIYAVEVFLYVSKTRPCRIFYYAFPFQKWYEGIGMFLCITFQCLFREYSHSQKTFALVMSAKVRFFFRKSASFNGNFQKYIKMPLMNSS